MELKEGMYVRTKDGIIDKVIIDYEGHCNNPNCNCKHISCKYDYYDENKVIKASNNIIDLIEAGDYVNGFPVIHKENDILKCGLLVQFKENEIKSIVTKEQFESLSYKVV